MQSFLHSQRAGGALRHRVDDAVSIGLGYIADPDLHYPVVADCEYITRQRFTHAVPHTSRTIGFHAHALIRLPIPTLSIVAKSTNCNHYGIVNR